MSEIMKKAEYLFDEIGLIDDALVSEAISLDNGTRRTPVFRRTVIVAAAAAMLFTASVGLTLSALIRRNDKLNGQDRAPTHDGMTSDATLVDVLSRAENSEVTQTYTRRGSIDLFDGKTKIIWQNGETGLYYALTVTESADRQELERTIDLTYKASENIGEDTESVSLWISYGDGNVVSPYLRESVGNVGYGELFDYSPEIVPSQDLARLVDDLILK